MQDKHGHRISYLRVSITDRCNERCGYCMPAELQEWLPRDGVLTYEEILRIIDIPFCKTVRQDQLQRTVSALQHSSTALGLLGVAFLATPRAPKYTPSSNITPLATLAALGWPKTSHF